MYATLEKYLASGKKFIIISTNAEQKPKGRITLWQNTRRTTYIYYFVITRNRKGR